MVTKFHVLCHTNPSFIFRRREERTIARALNLLKDFGGIGKKIAKGVYTHPFEFILPASLPSSTQFPRLEGKTFHGRINYRLRAEIGDLSYDRDFIVASAPLPNNVVPCIAQPTTHELKQAMILSKGFLSVGACVENSFVGRGQTLKVSVACRNDSSVDVDRVRIKLIELIEYKAQDAKNTIKNELVDIMDINRPGLIKYRSKDNVRKRRFSQIVGSTYQQILQDLTSGQNRFQLSIPKTARDSYGGNLISISHYLKITFYTKLSVQNPKMKIPIVVGTPRSDPRHHGLERAPNEPIATVVGDDLFTLDTPNLYDEAPVEVGYDLPPLVEAVILPPPEESPNTGFPLDRNVGLGGMLPYTSDDEDYSNDDYDVVRSSLPAPSAPDESLFMQERVSSPPGEIHGCWSWQSSAPGQRSQPPPPANVPYATYKSPHQNTGGSVAEISMAESTVESTYRQERLRSRIDSYSYDEITAASALTEPIDRPQLGHAQCPSIMPPRLKKDENSKQLFDCLLRELRASIHDYEVIASKVRQPEYRELYSSLSPKELGQIVANVSMTYQVQVAVLLARHLATLESSFTCAHCAEAVNRTSSYFRTNMVEMLLPYCHDLKSNRNLIESELSAWERCVTKRAFEDLP